MKNIFLSLVLIIMASATAVGATQAYFSDVETSRGNTFAAGSLDLTIDGVNTNVVKFTRTGMTPDNQPTGHWTLANIGSVNGYLDIQNVTVVSNENGIIEPESEAGDTTAGVGELQDVLNLRLYFDVDKDGYWSTGDVMIYDGKVGAMPGSFALDRALAAGSDVRINAVFDWWSTPDDNKAMTDSFELGLDFELGQTAAQ